MYRYFFTLACAVGLLAAALPAAARNDVYDPDQDGDHVITLSELLRVIQFYNAGEFHCDVSGEDGYASGPGAQDCTPYQVDYNPQNWNINLSELLRAIQFYNGLSYFDCAESEDGFCSGRPPNVVFLLPLSKSLTLWGSPTSRSIFLRIKNCAKA